MAAALAVLFLGGCAVPGNENEAIAPRIRTAVYVDAGARNTGVYRWLELTARSPQLDAYPVDAEMIRAGVLDRTDVLVMPGGTATGQARALGPDGCARLKDYIRKGGGYIGICAGCFLVLEPAKGHPDMLGLVPYASDGPLGTAELSIRFNKRAKELTGLAAGTRQIRFSEGPVMRPSAPVEGSSFEVIATYDSDINPNGEPPRPSFAGQAAVVAGTYGKGRVYACAVHPEYAMSGDPVVKSAFRYVTGRDIDWTLPQRRRGQLVVGFVTLKPFGVELARFIQSEARHPEFDFLPVNRDSVRAYALEHVDAVFAPGGTDLPTGDVPVFTNAATLVDDLHRLEKTLAKQKDPAAPYVVAPDDPAVRKVRVAEYAGKGGGDYHIASRLVRSPNFEVTVVDGADVARGVLAQGFDMVIQPGGSCRAQCKALGPMGETNLVAFIRGGGSFFGSCAGAFMASQVNDPAYPRFGFVPYRDENEPVYRGGCWAQLAVTDAGRRVFPDSAAKRMVCYNGGPVFVPGDPVEDTAVDVLMTYDCENISTDHPDPVMRIRGKGAILGGRVGKGKVFISGPHPEGDYFADDIVDDGIAYLTGVRPRVAPYRRRYGTPVVRYQYSQQKGALDLFVHRLLPNPKLDIRIGSTPDALRHADVYVRTDSARDDAKAEDLNRFIANGGRVILLADTEKKRDAAAKLVGATVVTTYDAIYDALMKACD